MGKVIAAFAMSLDGFIADEQDGVWSLFKWLINGDTPLPLPNSDRKFMTSATSAAIFQERFDITGAHVTGRRDFDASNAWGGNHPMAVPVFIVTHSVPQEWANSAFTFVTEGVENAVAQAKQAAGDKHVLVGGSQITRQCLSAGLLDELQIDLVPVLLGTGIKLFDSSSVKELETTSVINAPGVTHLTFRVLNR